MVACTVNPDSRRIFWTTRADGCGTDVDCGQYVCGIPGLQFTSTEAVSGCSVIVGEEGCDAPPCVNEEGPQRTLSNEDWITSTVINMLMTDGREPNTACGYRPGAQGGHWSESYIEGGATSVGTLMRTVKPQGSIQQNVDLIAAYASSTLQRLVTRGVASSVDVVATYIGNLTARLDITIYGQNNGMTNRVGLTGVRSANGWVWG